jgi:hypothetical protein
VKSVRDAGETPPARRQVIVPVAGTADAADLRARYDRYRSVSGGLAPDLISTPEMVVARVALIRLLLADGWVAPPVVLERLRQDEELLQPRLRAVS